MWTLAYGHHRDRSPTHGYKPNREAAIAGKSWHTAPGVAEALRTLALDYDARGLLEDRRESSGAKYKQFQRLISRPPFAWLLLRRSRAGRADTLPYSQDAHGCPRRTGPLAERKSRLARTYY
ncbi:MAG: hypothetical protein ACM3OF_08510 [Gemmatimonas sp.]